MIAVKRLRIENLEGRFVIQSVNVDLGTIDHSKPTVLTDESEKQIGATEDHRLGTLCLTQLPPAGEENLSLRLGYATGYCHLYIAIVHLLECVPFGPDNLSGGDPAVKRGLHNRLGAEYPDPLKIPSPDRGIDLRNRVQDGQW